MVAWRVRFSATLCLKQRSPHPSQLDHYATFSRSRGIGGLRWWRTERHDNADDRRRESYVIYLGCNICEMFASSGLQIAPRLQIRPMTQRSRGRKKRTTRTRCLQASSSWTRSRSDVCLLHAHKKPVLNLFSDGRRPSR